MAIIELKIDDELCYRLVREAIMLETRNMLKEGKLTQEEFDMASPYSLTTPVFGCTLLEGPVAVAKIDEEHNNNTCVKYTDSGCACDLEKQTVLKVAAHLEENGWYQAPLGKTLATLGIGVGV